MEYYGGYLCISYDELTGGADPLVRVGTLKGWQNRRQIKQVRKAYGEGVTALFEYASLKKEVRDEFERRYGDPTALIPKPGERYYVEDVAARNFYESYIYYRGGKRTTLKESIIEEYITNASVCNMLVERLEELTALSNKLGNRRRDMWGVMADYSEALRVKYHHTLPRSAGRLRTKVMIYKEEGYKSLISGRVGNSNTAKITEEAGLYILGLKRNRNDVLTNGQLLDEYNATCDQLGYKPITLTTLTGWLNEPRTKQLWLDVEQGEVAANKEFTRLQHTYMPTRRNSVWEGDGTRLNLYYCNSEGNLDTIDVYLVIDVATKMWLGWSYGKGETFEMAQKAFRMALERAGERPYQIKTDNQGALVSARGKKLLEDIALMRSNSAPYRSSSKMIENEIGDFQQLELHRYPNFTGQNVPTGKRPNLEFLRANPDRVPDYQGMIEQFEAAIKRWNSTVEKKYGKTREELYSEWVNDELAPVGRMDYIRIFWVEHDHTNIYTQSGITITVDKKAYTYEVLDERGLPDVEWLIEHTHERFQVRYNPENLDEACIYSIDKDGSKRFERELSPCLRIVRAAQDQSVEDARFAQILVNMDKQMRILRVARTRAIDYLFDREYQQPKVAGLSAEDNEKIERIARELYDKYKDRVRLPNASVVIEQVQDEAEEVVKEEKVAKISIPTPGQLYKEESRLDWVDSPLTSSDDNRAKVNKKYF